MDALTSGQPNNYDEYRNFCIGRGQRLCTLEELCPDAGSFPRPSAVTGEDPTYPVFDGDMWIPFEDDTLDNQWVQLGTRADTNFCGTHREVTLLEYGAAYDPDASCPVCGSAWGTDDTGSPTNSFMRYSVCCEDETPDPALLVYGLEGVTGRPTNYGEYETHCTDRGARLCTLAELCPNNIESSSGVAASVTALNMEDPPVAVFDADEWIPFQSTTAGLTNQWVQLGRRNSDLDVCETHRQVTGGADPSWGTDTSVQTWMSYHICCVD